MAVLRFKSFLLLAILGLASTYLLGCAAKSKVHVIAPLCSPDELTKIYSALEEIKQVSVLKSDAELPNGMLHNSILIPKLVQDFTVIENLASTLTMHGFETHISYINKFNHHYKDEHIGVYITHCTLATSTSKNSQINSQIAKQVSKRNLKVSFN
ncbi:hypothetical protein C1E23_08405 [Pseudoalteromonas phenolica]|uniref:Uncharacterized protein n=1 Tax=Pseudoalteromonas phenolica TaxID=161398 RepID=A0A4Q7IQC1_9GAMM|nr:hypothetical protein [Pseudoalteromonas phenolica]RZQ53656.1 hypothetical protein C1E23_08405 [Pseudoalteromonas phenolica]